MLQIGNAVGFAVPSLLVRTPSEGHTNVEGIGTDMKVLGYGSAIFSSVTCVLALLGELKNYSKVAHL